MSDSSIEPAGQNLPATAADMGLDSGLEDFDTTDMVMPRLSINHPEATFVDNLTNEEHKTLKVVLLGLVKQRILWGEEVNDGDRPLCKSYNFREGVPDPATFPLNASGFDHLPQEGGTLPCDACHLKEWGTNPKNSTPWCSEQHTFPLLMPVGDPDEGNFSAPAILTVQRSALKGSKSYLTGFARTKTPLFTVVTELTLDPQKKGSVHYAVPRFVRLVHTPNERWHEYAEQYRTIREFLTTIPEEDPGPVAGGGPDDRYATTATPSEAAVAADDDELPF